jgi:hypothetical protein
MKLLDLIIDAYQGKVAHYRTQKVGSSTKPFDCGLSVDGPTREAERLIRVMGELNEKTGLSNLLPHLCIGSDT